MHGRHDDGGQRQCSQVLHSVEDVVAGETCIHPRVTTATIARTSAATRSSLGRPMSPRLRSSRDPRVRVSQPRRHARRSRATTRFALPCGRLHRSEPPSALRPITSRMSPIIRAVARDRIEVDDVAIVESRKLLPQARHARRIEEIAPFSGSAHPEPAVRMRLPAAGASASRS